jgi:hypothetical protein
LARLAWSISPSNEKSPLIAISADFGLGCIRFWDFRDHAGSILSSMGKRPISIRNAVVLIFALRNAKKPLNKRLFQVYIFFVNCSPQYTIFPPVCFSCVAV